MSTSLTIASLIADRSLDTRLISGADGLDRTVLWAHTCELNDPSTWLGPNELLMTVGLCVPKSASEQRAFIVKLHEAGLAGITIGDHNLAPRITKAMLEESDSRGFPVLSTGPEVAFALLGRTVAAANANQQTMSVLQLARLYQVAGNRDMKARRSGVDLGGLFNTALTVVDEATGCVVIGEGTLPRPGQRPRSLRSRRPSHMRIDADADLDSLFLAHLAQILAVDADAITERALARCAEGGAAFELALTGRRQGQAALIGLWGGDRGAYRVVVTTCTVSSRVSMALALRGVPPTLLESGDKTTIVTPAATLPLVAAVLGDLGLVAGASAEHHDLADLAGAIAEAGSEHDAAAARQAPWSEYTGEQVSLLARSRSEADTIVRAVLGPLAQEGPRWASLRHTLFVMLDNDLRWNVTAEALGLHRQSLVYRLDRIEEHTGRSVRKTKDVAEFWLARTAWERLHPAG